MLKLYIRPVCLLRPEEEVASLSLLVESRREKVRTIKGKENRSRSIAAGLLLRHMLLEEQIPYAEESFGLEGHGKPRLKKDGVFFNLSHAGAYVAGVLSDVPVGVDVEQQNRFLQETRNRKLAKRILTEAEWNWWKDAGDDPQELLRFWTRKESYVKMTGEGMTKAFHTVDTLHGKYYKEIPLGNIKDRYLISVCTQEDRTCDFVCKMLD